MEEVYRAGTIIETEHLILRDLEIQDSQAIFENINNDRDVLRYYLAPYHEKANEEYIQSTIDFHRKTQRYCWAIVLKESAAVIGMINQCNSLNIFMQNVELGYAIGRKYWNKGYVTEAVLAVKDFLFERGIHKLYCGCVLENIASRRVMEKAGMILEGIRRDEFYYHDQYWDVAYLYCLNPYH